MTESRASGGPAGSSPSRDDRWDMLTSEEFDVLVLGGGINGAAVARDAQMRGLKTALVEREDFSSGTSSHSSKLVHGGLRYLETYQFHLVRESTAERAVQMRLAPHLVRPLPFLFPVYKRHPHGIFFMDLGLWLYDTLALYRVPKLHRVFDKAQTAKRQGRLAREGLKGALWYFDCATDDARLVLENILDAVALGAVALNYVSAVGLLRGRGGVCGAQVRDELTGRSGQVRAKMVVSTLGPFTDRFLARSGVSSERLVRGSRGSHLVFDASRLELSEAVVMLSDTDHRPVFAIPWGDRVYVGTTDVDQEGDPSRPSCVRSEADYLFDVLHRYFPDIHLGPKDVLGAWSGIRPLAYDAGEQEASRVSREHRILEVEQGLVVLVGGKLTTYRLMAAELLDLVCRLAEFSGAGHTRTQHRLLPGAVGLDDAGGIDGLVGALADEGLDVSSAEMAVKNYGVAARQVVEHNRTRLLPGRPELLSQVDWAVEQEFAVRLADVLLRRTSLGLRDARLSLQAMDTVAARMAELLGWDEERIAEEKRRYEEFIEEQMAFVWRN